MARIGEEVDLVSGRPSCVCRQTRRWLWQKLIAGWAISLLAFSLRTQVGLTRRKYLLNFQCVALLVDFRLHSASVQLFSIAQAKMLPWRAIAPLRCLAVAAASIGALKLKLLWRPMACNNYLIQSTLDSIRLIISYSPVCIDYSN